MKATLMFAIIEEYMLQTLMVGVINLEEGQNDDGKYDGDLPENEDLANNANEATFACDKRFEHGRQPPSHGS